MENNLTKKQHQVLQFIGRFLASHGYPPTIMEIGIEFQITIGAVQDHLTALKRKGYLRWQPGKARSIELACKPYPAPVYGRASKGNPVFSEENIEGKIEVVHHCNQEIFALRVYDDSMTNAGIRKGDIVIVRKQTHAKNNDIVITLINGKATLKRYRLHWRRRAPKPANHNCPAIKRNDFEVIGKVIELRRMY